MLVNWGKLLVDRNLTFFSIFSLLLMIFSNIWCCTFGRSNFLGTKFTIYDSQPPHDAAIQQNCQSSRRFHSKQVSPRVPACSYLVSTVSYELNVLCTRGPRRMHCVMNSIPVSAIQEGGNAPTPTSFPQIFDEPFSPSPAAKEKVPVPDLNSASLSEPLISTQVSTEQLELKNKAPRWHEQLQCWCLNFKGRVSVASVKNFQLVAAVDPSHNVSAEEQDKVILQFGKIGKDIFTMDYRYPLSTFQAFAICLSSFDTKPACEWDSSLQLDHHLLSCWLSIMVACSWNLAVQPVVTFPWIGCWFWNLFNLLSPGRLKWNCMKFNDLCNIWSGYSSLTNVLICLKSLMAMPY